MGTEILRPQDCLIRSVPSLQPSRRFSPAKLIPSNKPFRKASSPTPEPGRRGRGSNPQKPNIGKVTILKGTESLDRKKTKEDRICSTADEAASVDGKSEQKQIRLLYMFEDGYAGSAFSISPSPRSLPLPSFTKRDNAASPEEAVNLSATTELRRLLRLE